MESGDVKKRKTAAKDGAKSSEPKRRRAKSETKTRTKAPVKVDLDKHCGVPLVSPTGEPTGSLCVRSLSCKTHPMAAKRAIAGRSKPFDVLFNAYQQRNSMKNATTAFNNQQRQQAESEARRDEPPLSDAEEINEVLRGAIFAAPQPLACQVLVPTRKRTHDLVLREMLYKSVAGGPPPPLPPPPSSMGISPPLASILAATDAVYGRCVVYNPKTDQETIRPAQIDALRTIQRKISDRWRSSA